MRIINKTKVLQDYIADQKKNGKSIGFTPTMGALHEGHFSLIRRSVKENNLSICSVFVNPTQFNVASDLEHYPRTIEQDARGLEVNNCDILYTPDYNEVYPNGSDYKVDVNLNGLDKIMEGAQRPGHFEGVIQVVKRLIEVTQCDRIYMGQKDFQQFTIIRQMIDDLNMSTSLVVCPILRDEDGLAKSSRNFRLLPIHRKKANIIHRVLQQSKDWLLEDRSPVEISMKAVEYMSIPGFKPEYFDLIDGYTLKKVRSQDDHEVVVACTSVWVGDVRLIDNMILKGNL